MLRKVLNLTAAGLKTINDNFTFLYQKIMAEGVSKIKTGAVDESALSDDAVTLNKIASGEISRALIRDLQVDGADIHTLKVGQATIGNATVDTIDINYAKLDTAKINFATITNLQADEIIAKSTEIDFAKITNVSITTADIDFANISTVQADEIIAKTTTIDFAKISNVSIDSADINFATLSTVEADNIIAKATSIDFGKITNVMIEESDIADAAITDAKILNLSANKINAGVLDASNIEVINLKADSITTGSLNIIGDNLLKNTDFEQGRKNWEDSSVDWQVSSTEDCMGTKAIGVSRSGLSTTTAVYLNSDHIPVIPGENLVYTGYYMSPSWALVDSSTPVIYMYFYSSTGSYKGYALDRVVKSGDGSWQQFRVNATVPDGADYCICRHTLYRNGELYYARLMLQKGNISSPWRPQTAEQIGDGDLNGNKIEQGTIHAGLFQADAIQTAVGNITEAFIHNAHIVDMDASKITVGEMDAVHIKAHTVSADKFTSDAIEVAVANITTAFIKDAHIEEVSANKITAGTMEADRISGGTLTLGGLNGVYGRLNLLDGDGEVVGEWGSDNTGSFSKLKVHELEADNVIKSSEYSSEAVVINVSQDWGNDTAIGDDSNPIKTIGEALRRIPKNINRPYIIKIYGHHFGKIYIAGYFGAGTLTVEFQGSAASLTGGLHVMGCSCVVNIKGSSSLYIANINQVVEDTELGATMLISCSQFVNIGPYLKVNGTNTSGKASIKCDNGSCVHIEDVEINYNAGGYAIMAINACKVFLSNLKGYGNSFGVWSSTLCHFYSKDNVPDCSTPYYNADGSTVFRGYYNKTTSSPSGIVSTTVKTYNAIDTASYRNGSWRTDNDRIYQGNWGYGNHYGCVFFSTAQMKADLNGKTIKSAKLYVKRYSAGGYAVKEPLYMYDLINSSALNTPALSTYHGVVGNLDKGEEIEIDITDKMSGLLGTANGFCFKTSGGYKTDYVLLEGISSYTTKIVVTY